MINTCLVGAGPYRQLASYSHILAGGILFVMSVFILYRDRKVLNVSFFAFIIYFVVWLAGDWITWISNNYHIVNAAWSILDYIDIVGFLAATYFYSVFVNENDIKPKYKLLLLALTFYPLYLVLTGQSILGFNLPQCESFENTNLTHYRFTIEALSILAIIVMALRTWFRRRNEISKVSFALISFSIVLFLSTFSLTGLISSQTAIYEVQLYGMFVLPIFVLLMIIAIGKYDTFHLKFWNQQLLAWTLVPLIASEFFFLNGITDFILNTTTLIISFAIVYLLSQNIKKETENRLRIEALNRELLETNDKLKELDRQKTEFISVASHQLRGPLTAIKGYASLILEGDFGEFSAQIKEAVETIFKSTQALVVIVGDYLDVSRIEQGRMRYEFSDFDLKPLAEGIINEFQPNIRVSGLSLTFKHEDGKDFFVHADQGKLKQVVSNIIDNSIKYTPHGSIEVSLARVDDHIRLSVKDTGVGIAKEVLPKLFDKFTRAPGASKTNITGTGLGLYVARKMMEAHRGKIWAESEGKDHGSTFIIELESLHKMETPLNNKIDSTVEKFDHELESNS